MTPSERKKELERISMMQIHEDAQARRFLLAILKAAEHSGARRSLIRQLALEANIYWRNIERARKQMNVFSDGWLSKQEPKIRWWAREYAPPEIVERVTQVRLRRRPGA